MSRKHLINRPIKNQDISFYDFDNSIDYWKDRTKLFELKKLRKLKHQMRSFQS